MQTDKDKGKSQKQHPTLLYCHLTFSLPSDYIFIESYRELLLLLLKACQNTPDRGN